MARLQDETVYATLIRRIASRLVELKKHYKHFALYDPQSANLGDRIWYRNNVQSAPTPNYKKLKEEQDRLLKEHPRPMIRKIDERTPFYPEEDGICLTIQFYSDGEMAKIQRCVVPDARIGEMSVEVILEGAQTQAITDIRKAIYRILDDEKKRFARSNAMIAQCSRLTPRNKMPNSDWKRDDNLFNDHLSKVLEGWTEKQLLEYAGPSDKVLDDEWIYRWSEPMGGLYSYFIFKIQNGIVVNIKRGGGCRATE